MSALLALLAVAPASLTAQHDNDPEEVTFRTEDGVRIYADLYTSGDNHAPTIFLFHQAGSNARAEYAPIVPRLTASGYNVVAVDQRSGGDRLGGVNRTVDALDSANFSYCDAYPDLEAALRFADERGFDGPRAVWGSSYSAALVVKLGAEHGAELDAVLAFSPASGRPMGACSPQPFEELLAIPVMALRPASEMENPAVREQLDRFETLGHTTYVAANGVHGSSMLNPDRVDGSVEPTWAAVEAFLAASLAPAAREDG